MRVQIYKNLHNNMWSVRSKKSGKVIAHMNKVYLINCKFTVRKSGRKRVLKERIKNVHAFVEGDLVFNKNINTVKEFIKKSGFPITYNPYKYETFAYKFAEIAIYESNICYMDKTSVVTK